jgi:hypothetical protein
MRPANGRGSGTDVGVCDVVAVERHLVVRPRLRDGGQILVGDPSAFAKRQAERRELRR